MEEQQPDRRWIILAVFAVVAVGVVAAVLIGRGGGDDESTRRPRPSAGGCKKVEAPKPKNVSFKAPKQTREEGRRS